MTATADQQKRRRWRSAAISGRSNRPGRLLASRWKMQSSEFMAPVLSVIVATFNRTSEAIAHTQRCLASLMATSDPNLVEIIITDDCSPIWQPIEWYGPPIKVSRNERNLGFAANCNQGAKLATAPWLLFLNSDTLAQMGWMQELLVAIKRHPNAVLGPKLIFPPTDGIARIQSAGGLYDSGKHPFHRYIGSKADWSGVNIEEGYVRGYFEDVDLCERAKQAGAEIWYVPSACFIHATGQSTAAQDEDEKVRFARTFQHNRQRFHVRWDSVIEPDIGAVLQPGL